MNGWILERNYLFDCFIVYKSNSVSKWCVILWHIISLQRLTLILQLVGLICKFYISYLLVIFCCVTNYPQTSGLKQQYFAISQNSVDSLVSAASMWCQLELLIYWHAVGVWSDLESQRSLHCLMRSLCFSTQLHHRGRYPGLPQMEVSGWWDFLNGIWFHRIQADATELPQD